MSTAPLKPCRNPRCAAMAVAGSAWCASHQPAARQQQVAERSAKDDRRGSAASRGYGSRWRTESAAFRALHPICGGYLVPGPQYDVRGAKAYGAQRASAAGMGKAVAFLQQRVPWLLANPIYRLVARVSAIGTTGCGLGVVLTDHIVPHRGDPELMWSTWNWQTLCKGCHDRKTASHDGGFRGASTPMVSRRGAENAEIGIL